MSHSMPWSAAQTSPGKKEKAQPIEAGLEACSPGKTNGSFLDNHGAVGPCFMMAEFACSHRFILLTQATTNVSQTQGYCWR